MEIYETRYVVEYYAKTIWGDYFSERKPFDTENEALAFIIHKLSKDPLVNRAFYTTTKEIRFNR